MKNYFIKLSKLCIGVLPVPQEVLDKLVEFHTEPMNNVREELGLPVYASQESGFRPYIWEIARGRSGKSKHCFGQQSSGVIYKHEKGAVDWTCEDFATNVDKFLKLILKHTKYTRIAVYKGFIHCDYGATDGKRYIYKSTAASKWTLKEVISF